MYADTEQEYTIGTYDGGLLQPHVNPVLNENGLPVYYQRSDQTYIKGYPVYDRDGDYVRYRYSDLLRAYNANAWDLQLKAALYDIGNDPEKREDDRPLYHRQGDAYLMENSWITGDEMPNESVPYTDQRWAGGRFKTRPGGNVYFRGDACPIRLCETDAGRSYGRGNL